MLNVKPYIIEAIRAAIAAGNAILEVYRSEFSVEYKSDKSPLTIADRKSHEIIMTVLTELNFPVLSEEGKDTPYEQRKNWEHFWMVDPLDGTKEFIKRNGEFTVNIALVEKGRPILGVIFVPDRSTLYFGARNFGAYKLENDPLINLLGTQTGSKEETDQLMDQIKAHAAALPIKDPRRSSLTIVGSRSHRNAELDAFVEEKRKEFDDVAFISAGSSLKICLVAEGKADLYPRLGPTMEWDTAAGHAIAQGAGATIYQYDTQQPLLYNKADLHNPWFIVQRDI
jgi:3'(2'), 5'-bisphosphate nucleotidase